VELIRQTWQNLRANRTRSLLTMFASPGIGLPDPDDRRRGGNVGGAEGKDAALGQNIMIVWGGLTSKGHQEPARQGCPPHPR